jgi:transcriptional regulator with XRE-family HTH domain
MKHRDIKRQTNNFDLNTLLSIRRTHGMPAAIARVAQVSPGFVSDILNGRKRPSARFLAALPRAFELVHLQSQARASVLAGASFKVSSKG